MREKIIQYIEDNKMFNSGDRVLIGVSGGPDSIALMDFLNDIKNVYHFKIVVCHLNHMLRGIDSDQDEAFVKNLCLEYGLEFYSIKKDIRKLAMERKTSIEETGRDERYHFFSIIKNEIGIDKVALGHHKDDNVETIFMRILRGTGIKGLRGIAAIREDGVVRPFLCVTKKEILEYSATKKLTSRLDQTNLETDYHRNKLRLEAIPYMESLNPNFTNNLDSLGKICRSYYDFVQEHVKAASTFVMEKDKINISKFNDLHEVLKTEILIENINRLDSTKSVEFQHILMILEKLKDHNNTTWRIDLPKSIVMTRQYHYLYPQKRNSVEVDENYYYTLIPNKVYVFPKIGLTLKVDVYDMDRFDDRSKKPKTGYFDYDQIFSHGTELNIRNRKQGDKIKPVGLRGTKKIKDILINKKIPAQKRWKIPLFCIDNEVMWIVGYHRSNKFTLSEDTKKVLQVSYNYHEEEKHEK